MARGGKNQGARSVVESNVTPTEDAGGPKRKICRPEYREEHLEPNGIFLVQQDEVEVSYPTSPAKLIKDMIRTRCVSQTLQREKVKDSKSLQNLWEHRAESVVASFLKRTVFPDEREGAADFIVRHEQVKMTKLHVPKNPRSKAEVSTPIPDMLYGYNHLPTTAFSEEELGAQMTLLGPRLAAGNTAKMRFPFLVVEAKGDEPFREAVYQCLGAASTCVRITNRLNEKLHLVSAGQATPVETAAFSVAVNGFVAILYVTWFHNNKYLTRQVQRFHLDSRTPDDFIEFHSVIQNILDWGQGERLDEIKAGVAALNEFEDPEDAPPSSRTRRQLATRSDEYRTPPAKGKRKRVSIATEDSTFQDPSSILAKRPRITGNPDPPPPFGPQPVNRSVDEHGAKRGASGGQTAAPILATSVLTKRRPQRQALGGQHVNSMPPPRTSASKAVDLPTASCHSPPRPFPVMEQENRSPAKDITPRAARAWEILRSVTN
ncbi:hypothetical protein V8F06_012667 [Rhypophila decipiens]